MKIKLVLLFIVLSYQTQAQDYMTTITESTCDCIKSIPDSMKGNALLMKLGICMMKASAPYQKKIKKDYDIDLATSDGPRALGQLIGSKLITVCPDNFEKLLNVSDQIKEDEEEAVEEVAAIENRGTIIKIENNEFVRFTIEDESNVKKTYYWLDEIATDIENLESEYNTLLNKIISFESVDYSVFNPKTKSYEIIKVLTSITK